MVKSMTGYGKATGEINSKKITVEIKSLNSKNLDVYARIPSSYKEKELEMRSKVSKSLLRGKIDFSLYIEASGEETNTKINEEVVSNYMKQLGQVVDGDDIELLKMAVRLPDSLKTQRKEINETEFQEINKIIDVALQKINTYREDEGKVLEQDFIKRSVIISDLLKQVIEIDTQRIDNVKERLRKSVSDLKEAVDENRFEQELIYYLEKYDITEEKVRLKNHLDYFNKNIKTTDSNGKKLGFICQEIGREINTIGSKSNFAPMQQLVVQMKDELEKIKEQSLNVL
jgi:uncharacterized protein (TIGR00255 family)